jgi:hypothetical protein
MLKSTEIRGGGLMREFRFTHFVQIECDVVGRAGLVEEESEGPKSLCFVELYRHKGVALMASVDKSCLRPMESEEVIK